MLNKTQAAVLSKLASLDVVGKKINVASDPTIAETGEWHIIYLLITKY